VLPPRHRTRRSTRRMNPKTGVVTGFVCYGPDLDTYAKVCGLSTQMSFIAQTLISPPSTVGGYCLILKGL
jgi:hypothetical protein